MKKHLAAALVAAAIPALWVSPAGAAVPTKEAKSTLACPDGHGQARVWWTVSKGALTKLAVDNPCTQNLVFASSGPYYGSGAADDEWLAAPGSHFNWGKARIAQYHPDGTFSARRFTPFECGGPTTRTVVSKYNDVRPGLDDNGEGC